MKLERVLYACHGRVARSANDMKTLGDLAKYNTDKLSKGEKEAKDYEYAESSKLAKDKLRKQTMERPFYHNGESKKVIQKLAKATPKQKKKYLEDGTI